MSSRWSDVTEWGCQWCGEVVENPESPATCPNGHGMLAAKGSPFWESSDILGGDD